MRTLATFTRPLTATLCLAFLAAGCDRLASLTTTNSTPAQDPARYTVVKDTTGKTVRLDKLTGEVAPVEKTDAAAVVPPRPTRTPAAGRRTRPSSDRLASLATMTPAGSFAAKPVVVPRAPVAAAAPAVPARIASDEMCAEHDDIFAVTLMDAAVFARPALGTPLVARVAGGTLVTMTGDSGEWLYVTFEGRRGPVSGFVHCSTLGSLRPPAGAVALGDGEF